MHEIRRRGNTESRDLAASSILTFLCAQPDHDDGLEGEGAGDEISSSAQRVQSLGRPKQLGPLMMRSLAVLAKGNVRLQNCL